MPEPFKLLINAERIRELAGHLHRVWPAFDRHRFESLALAELDALELKARAMRIADALESSLPDEFDQAATLIEAALGRPLATVSVLGSADTTGIAGWCCWSLGEFIARRGQEHPERALQALHAITQRFSAEFAIRPFIVRHPELCFATLRRWARDPSEHVRRLVSEGSRPRLPWGMQLRDLIADPAPALVLLEALQDDPSDYVRRSVANHLNDIAKDHPAIVADWLETHLPSASDERRSLLRHASRTLIKRCDKRVLKIWGLGATFRGSVDFSVSTEHLKIGEDLHLHVRIRSDAKMAQSVLVDYVVHHVKADGGTSAKVFKGWQLQLAAGESRELSRKHSFRRITTRVYYPGKHRLSLQINGRILAETVFQLEQCQTA